MRSVEQYADKRIILSGQINRLLVKQVTSLAHNNKSQKPKGVGEARTRVGEKQMVLSHWLSARVYSWNRKQKRN